MSRPAYPLMVMGPSDRTWISTRSGGSAWSRLSYRGANGCRPWFVEPVSGERHDRKGSVSCGMGNSGERREHWAGAEDVSGVLAPESTHISTGPGYAAARSAPAAINVGWNGAWRSSACGRSCGCVCRSDKHGDLMLPPRQRCQFAAVGGVCPPAGSSRTLSVAPPRGRVACSASDIACPHGRSAGASSAATNSWRRQR